MSVNYPLGDFLIRIKNGYLVKKEKVTAPWSKIKEAVAALLKKNLFIADYQVKEEKKSGGKKIVVKLRYSSQGEPALREVSLFSKPGRRIYVNYRRIPYPKGGEGGMVIISTPAGIMRGKEARQKKLGGEVIGEVW